MTAFDILEYFQPAIITATGLGLLFLVVVLANDDIFHDRNIKLPFRENPEEGYDAIRNLAETAVNQIMKFENLDEDERKGLLAIDVDQAVELFNKLMKSAYS